MEMLFSSFSNLVKIKSKKNEINLLLFGACLVRMCFAVQNFVHRVSSTLVVDKPLMRKASGDTVSVSSNWRTGVQAGTNSASEQTVHTMQRAWYVCGPILTHWSGPALMEASMVSWQP